MGSSARVHSVHFYDSHDSLIDRLCGVVCSGLLIGNSVLMVCTAEHRRALMSSLERLEVDVRDYARNGRFSMCDAAEMLSMFMVDGMPDGELFTASMGRFLVDAKNAARSKDRGLTVFGEMVAVLWEQGNKTGALALEKLWTRPSQSALSICIAPTRDGSSANRTAMSAKSATCIPISWNDLPRPDVTQL